MANAGFAQRGSDPLILEANREPDSNNVILQWATLAGYSYELQSSPDLLEWTSEGDWPGFGQTMEILVHEAPVGGGGGAPPPANPSYNFFLSIFQDGNTLVSWIGGDGQPYQVYEALDFSNITLPVIQNVPIDPTNGDPDFFLILFNMPRPFEPHFPGLSAAALPPSEQSRYVFFSSSYSATIQYLNSLPPAAATQSSSLPANAGPRTYFRLIESSLDNLRVHGRK